MILSTTLVTAQYSFPVFIYSKYTKKRVGNSSDAGGYKETKKKTISKSQIEIPLSKTKKSI